MKGGAVSESAPIYYEEMSKVAGTENDKQSITLIATDDAYNFGDYITLRSRTGHKPQVLTDRGAIISERMAEMMDAKVGDTITVTDSSGTERKVRVDGITEMHIGHFMFMTSGGYKHVFGEQYQSNAYMVRLKNHETSNVESRSAKLIKLDGAKGIVQNTTSKKQVATIVDLPDLIMEVLILAAELLAVVILYNLTNLNVSERIRELPTIKVLGGLGVLVYRRLKTVDMLGSLKSVE